MEKNIPVENLGKATGFLLTGWTPIAAGSKGGLCVRTGGWEEAVAAELEAVAAAADGGGSSLMMTVLADEAMEFRW